ncbi:MAG: CRISPR-associated endonuclease Cas2 [Candidatus Sungiibacteriota bacterium]
MNIKKDKKIRDQRLRVAVSHHEDFLIRRLGKEWGAIERRAKGEALVRYAKMSSAVVGRTVLALLLLAGTVTIIAIAPNMFAAVDRLTRRKVFFEKKGIQSAHRYLKKKKFIMSAREKDCYQLTLTEKGRVRALSATFQGLKIHEQPQWDGMWRVVMFDIPDKKKWARDTFRRSLREMGFLQMQKSVFISPYPCEEEVEFLTAMFDVAGHVRLIRTDTIIHDHDLRTFFSL